MRPLSLAIVLLAAVAAAAPAKKKKRPEPPTPAAQQAAISKVLDGEQEKVAQCVLASAPDGEWSLDVHVMVTITGAGQLMSCRVVLDPERTGSSATSDCVDKVLRAAPYPKTTGAPLINIDRKWTFAMK